MIETDTAHIDASLAELSELRLDMLFYSCTNLAAVEGLGNLRNVTSMRYAFAGIAAAELDFRGFDPLGLTDLYYCFGGCSSLARIYADASWELPSGGVSGAQCFYNCPALVGGAGTVWSPANTSYAHMRIDAEGQPGYLTAG